MSTPTEALWARPAVLPAAACVVVIFRNAL
jgi:hypothetical protein